MAAKHVVFTVHAGELRATPGNVVVDLGAGDPPLLKFTNLAGHDVVVAMQQPRNPFAVPSFTIASGASTTQPFTPGVPLGQYEYSAYAPANAARREAHAKGGSDPGIIITA